MTVRPVALALLLAGCGAPETQRMLEVGQSNVGLTALDDLPVGMHALQVLLDEDLEKRGVEVKPAVRADKSITLPGLDQIRYCKTCVDPSGLLTWITSHEIVHVWQFDPELGGYKVADYLDTPTRFGMELQAGRFQMWVAALSGWRAREWRASAIDQINESSKRHDLTPREHEIVTDILNDEWSTAWEIAAPHYEHQLLDLDT